MIVYGVFYNSCIYESAAGLQSLHISANKANEAMDILVQEKLARIIEDNEWCKAQGMHESVQKVEIKDYERFFVQEVEVLE